MTRPKRSVVCLACLAALAVGAGAARAQHEEPSHAVPAGADAQPQDPHAGDAHAPGGANAEGHEVSPFPAWKEGVIVGAANLVVFGLVLAVLARTVWPKINKGLADREAKIKHEIEAAEAARRQAKDALEAYEHSLAEARHEAKRMLDEVKAQQQSLAAELRAKADAEVASMKDRARRDIDAAKRAAMDEVYTASVDLASRLAGKILRRELSGQDYRRLLDESMAELQAARN